MGAYSSFRYAFKLVYLTFSFTEKGTYDMYHPQLEAQIHQRFLRESQLLLIPRKLP